MGQHSKDLVPRRKRKRRATSHAAYAGMLRRMHFGAAKRIGADPDALELLLQIEADSRDAINLGIYIAHYRKDHPASLTEIGQKMGISKQAAAKRVNLGRVVADRVAAAGQLDSRPGPRAIGS